MTVVPPSPTVVGKLKHKARRLAELGAQRAGFHLIKQTAATGAWPIDFDDAIIATIETVQPYTLTTPERIFALCEAVRYLVTAKVPGAFIECGVWRGGSALAMIRTLQSMGVDDRDLYLFDTYDHMPPPGDEDIDALGVPAKLNHELYDSGQIKAPEFEHLPFEQVRRLLEGTGYPPERIHFVKGLVEDTIPGEAPQTVALLRLDTDYYASTKHELEHLYPRLSVGGALLIDDYGHFLGCRQATDEYLAELAQHDEYLLLQRIDYSARLGIVPAH